MKLPCNVEVRNRLLSEHSIVSSARSCKSSLNLAKCLGSDELFVFLSNMKNKQPTKYKVRSNIAQVFTKFLKEGKATIRFHHPPHDLCIKADPLQLKSFLVLIKTALTTNAPMKSLPVLSPDHQSKIVQPKTKLIVNTKGDYPTLEGFPRTLQLLQVTNIELKKFDTRILALNGLRTLDLSYNRLREIPAALNLLHALQELNVSHNELGRRGLAAWQWLGRNPICALEFLDMSYNEVEVIPKCIYKLESLVNLKLAHNNICKLPGGIGHLKKLRFLLLSHNNLQFVPGSMSKLQLESLDLSGNPLVMSFPAGGFAHQKLEIPSLKELSARKVIKSRISPTPEMLPMCLIYYLAEAKFCVCGSPCFETAAEIKLPLNLSAISQTLVTDRGMREVAAESYVCSTYCENVFTEFRCRL